MRVSLNEKEESHFGALSASSELVKQTSFLMTSDGCVLNSNEQSRLRTKSKLTLRLNLNELKIEIKHRHGVRRGRVRRYARNSGEGYINFLKV